MENSTAFEAVFKIRLDDSGVQQGLQKVAAEFQSSTERGKKESRGFSDSILGISAAVSTAYSSIKSLGSAGDVLGGLTDSYNRYEAAMNGVKSVASATGQSVSQSMQVVRDASESGLISQSDAATAVKNLELYGYTAEQAGKMINVLTDAAAYNRQSNYDLGEAVRVTTEGIRMENSVLSDAAGVQKNIAKMHEEYADSLGKTTDELSQSEKAQAVYNGILAEAGIFAGDAEQYSDSLAGSQSRLNAEIENISQNLGSALGEAVSPFISGLADWLSNNEELVAGVAAFAGVLIGAGGLAVALVTVVKAIQAVRAALVTTSLITQVVKFGFAGLAIAVAGVAASMAVSSVINKTADATEELGDASNDAAPEMEKMSDAAEKAAKKIAKLEQQLRDLDRDYARDLKQIGVKHQENLDKLTQQIEEANIDYRRAIDERMADFNVNLAKQERSHQETVNELMTQLAFLQRYNNDYNKQKLAQVQFALAKEQELYRRETETQRAEIELQNQADRQKLESKLISLQQELAEEQAFMDKHREDLKSVQDVMLLDEVESLQERYLAQKASYQEQIAEARRSGAEIGDGLGNNIKDALDRADFKKKGEDMGKAFIDGMWEAIEEGMIGKKGSWDGIFGGVGKRFYNLFNGNGFGTQDFDYVNGRWVERKYKGGGWASGGYTGPGPKNEVAGIVHRGEYVIPQEGVDQSTGLPKTLSPVQNVYININGTFATSAAERRKVALEVKKALADVDQARLTSEQARVVI